MFIRITASLCAAGLLAGFAVSAQAGPFVAATAAITSSEFEDVKAGTGFAFSAGYELPQIPLFVEGEYYTSGALKADNNPDFPELDDLRVSYRGFLGNIGYAVKLDGGSKLWLKGGYYSLKGKTSLDDQSITEKDGGFTFGVGGDWMFSRQVGLRAEVEAPFKVKSAPGLDLDEKDRSQLSIIRVGLVWRPQWGSSTPATAPPVYTDGARYAPYQAPVTASIYGNSTAMPFAVGATAKLAAGTTLRGQPKPNGDLSGTLPAETAVTLQGNSSGAYGDWWFVKGPGVRGWVMASELQMP